MAAREALLIMGHNGITGRSLGGGGGARAWHCLMHCVYATTDDIVVEGPG